MVYQQKLAKLNKKMSYSRGLFLNITDNDKKKWKEDIDFIKKLTDINHVEIWFENIYLSSDDIMWIKTILSEYTLIVHAPFINLSLISGHQAINKSSIDILKKTIYQAIKLGAKLVTIHAGAYPLFMKEKDVRNSFTKNFKELYNYTKDRISLSIENISRNNKIQISYPVLLSEFEVLKDFIPNINYTLDIGHCIQNNDDFKDFLSNNVDIIKNIHLHNAIINGSAHFGFNKPGDIKLDAFLRFLSKIDYRNFLSLEIIDKQDIKKSWELFIQ